MHDDDNPRRQLAPHEKDDRDQEAIMALVISEHPIQLTLSELVRQMVPPGAKFIESDDIERGVRELVGVFGEDVSEDGFLIAVVHLVGREHAPLFIVAVVHGS